MGDPSHFNYFDYLNLDLEDLDPDPDSDLNLNVIPEYREMEEMDHNFPDPQIYGQATAQFDQCSLAPGSSAFPVPFNRHFPPTPSSTSPESAQGQIIYDTGTVGHSPEQMTGYQSTGPSNMDYTETTCVQLPPNPMQGQTASEAEAESLMSQMNQWLKLIGESVPRLRHDRQQLLSIRRRFHDGFHSIDSLFDQYLMSGDKSPTSNISTPFTPRPSHNSLRKEFLCCLCKETGKMMDKGTFRRHVLDKHLAPAVYVCPISTCDKRIPRRDKLADHLYKHGHVKLQKEELTRFKVDESGPFQCGFCKEWYHTWEEFWECFQNHSRVFGGVNQPRNNGNRDNNSGDGNYGGGASGPGASGPFGGQLPGSFGGTGHQHSQQGYGAYQSGGYSGYFGYNNRGACIQKDESPLSDSPCVPTSCSEASIPEPSTLLRDTSELPPSLEKVRPPPPKKMESALTRALHARHSSAPALSRESHPGELGLISKDPDRSPRDVKENPRDSCKSCGHLFKGCVRCRTQKHVVDRCHACADKTCSLQQPSPLRIEIPRSRLLSKDVSTTLSESSPPSSEQDDWPSYDESKPEHLDNGMCGTTFAEALSGKWKINNDDMQKWNRKAAELDFLKALTTEDHGSECSVSHLTRALSEFSAESWSFTTRTWTKECGMPSKDSNLTSSNRTYRQSRLSLKRAEGGVTVTSCEVEFLSSLPKEVVSGSLYRSAMLCDPGLRIMLPFLGLYGLGSKADIFTKGHNMIPNIALQGASFIAKQMQSQHHNAPILRDAASTAAKVLSNKRSARLRKKLQAVARVLARYASVANAAPETVKQAITRKTSFDSKSTTPSCEVTRVGDDSAGPDSQALLERVCEIISFINTGMTDMFASPEYTFLDCDDDDDDNGMRWVMAFFWQFLIAILRMRNGFLIATEVVACT
ncbi:hypothetical protein BJX96DRAFT_145950 [Aspergillus floccosus]